MKRIPTPLLLLERVAWNSRFTYQMAICCEFDLWSIAFTFIVVLDDRDRLFEVQVYFLADFEIAGM
jgi:hypothetical protein